MSLAKQFAEAESAIDMARIKIANRWRMARGPAQSKAFVHVFEQRFQLAEALLWALAVEIDDRQATRTGYRVCRACGGRGEVIVDVRSAGRRVWSVSQCIDNNLTLHGIDVQDGAYMISCAYAVATTDCPCDGPTRPDTTSLARMVRLLATLGVAPYGDLPDRWQVHLDAMLVSGLGDVVLPGETRTTPAWMCRWWSAFNEWCVAGKAPDADALAADLDALTPRRDVETQRMAEMVGDTYARRGTVGGIRAAIISVDTVRDVEAYDRYAWPLPVDPYTVHVSWDGDGSDSEREAVEAMVEQSRVLGIQVIYEPWEPGRRWTAWNDAILRAVMSDERFGVVRWLPLEPPTFEATTDNIDGTVTGRFTVAGMVPYSRHTITVVAQRRGQQVGRLLSVESVEDYGEW